jgi:hypothetical protein
MTRPDTAIEYLRATVDVRAEVPGVWRVTTRSQ